MTTKRPPRLNDLVIKELRPFLELDKVDSLELRNYVENHNN